MVNGREISRPSNGIGRDTLFAIILPNGRKGDSVYETFGLGWWKCERRERKIRKGEGPPVNKCKQGKGEQAKDCQSKKLSLKKREGRKVGGGSDKEKKSREEDEDKMSVVVSCHGSVEEEGHCRNSTAGTTRRREKKEEEVEEKKKKKNKKKCGGIAGERKGTATARRLNGEGGKRKERRSVVAVAIAIGVQRVKARKEGSNCHWSVEEKNRGIQERKKERK
ncbi:uncharacterized protein [Prorops nasuta]|uniref:uncharacterized protein n=1 Tax=Prorops nasuta TaxID=863751 RepID=UPI0034CDD271